MREKEARVRTFRPTPVPRGLMPLVQQYFELLNEKELTLVSAAQLSNIPVIVLHGWKSRRKPTLENMVAAYQGIGLTLTPLAGQPLKPVFDGQSPPAPAPIDMLRPLGHHAATVRGTVRGIT